MKLLRLSLSITLVALIALTSVVHADPPDDPNPPDGYVYDAQTVNITSFSQALGSEILDDGGMEDADLSDWTLFAGTLEKRTDDPFDGFRYLRITNTGAGASAYQVRNGGLPYGSGAVVEMLGAIRNGNAIGATVGDSNGGTAWFSQSDQWVEFSTLFRPNNAVFFIGAYGGSSGAYADFDILSTRQVTPNPVWTATVDATHTLTFTLPVDPIAGQRIELKYRVVDTLNYWSAVLVRNDSNNQWNFQLHEVTGGFSSTRLSAAAIGTVDAIRVMAVGDEHRLYTGESGTFTQRGGTITDSEHSSATGITSIYSSAFTANSLSSWSIIDESSITPTPTPDASQTPAPTATPDLIVYGNVNGQPTRYVYSVTAADHAEIALLVSILLSIWALMLAALFILRNKS